MRITKKDSNYYQSEISAISDADDIYGMEEEYQVTSLLKDLSAIVQGKIIIAEDQPINI